MNRWRKSEQEASSRTYIDRYPSAHVRQSSFVIREYAGINVEGDT